MKQIESRGDIEKIVDEFYDKIKKDQLLGPIFNGVIKDRWPEHLDKMYRFWETVLLNNHVYSGSPFKPHAKLPVEQKHFDRWMDLFKETVYSYFEGPKADEAVERAGKMATMFMYKIDYFRDNPKDAIL
jgi:hemoglobin